MLKPDKIVIHHSLTKDSGTVSWIAIDYYHTHIRGWRDIGYHAGIEQVGEAFLCMAGRPIHEYGAHVFSHNAHTLGFCFVGNFDKRKPSNELLHTAARRVLVPWLLQFGLEPKDLVPHSDYADKTCPGTQFDIKALRRACNLELLDVRM